MTDYLAMAFLLLGLGVVMFAGEYFLPTGGVLVVGGLLLCMAGVGIVARYGDATETVAAILVLCIGVPLASSGAIWLWGKSAARRFGAPEAEAYAIPGASDAEQLRGRFGRTVTPMRPAGAVEFDGKRVAALAEGPMLEAGVWVRCVDVKPGKVIVRPVPRPPELGDLKLDDLK